MVEGLTERVRLSAVGRPNAKISRMTAVTIRVFEQRDMAAVVAMWRQVFAYDAPHNEPRFAIERKLADQPELFFVAEVDGQIVGTVMGGYDGHRGWIYLLAVAPGHRRQGIGRQLLRHVETELASRGCPKINLQVLADNSAVVKFYEACGFAVEPRISLGKKMR